uniref:hypothetical protein n=1 Tax=Eubacterium sp. TaxID=142586 RepID=UPI004026EA42
LTVPPKLFAAKRTLKAVYQTKSAFRKDGMHNIYRYIIKCENALYININAHSSAGDTNILRLSAPAVFG